MEEIKQGEVSTETNSQQEEKKYTQADMDRITNKVRESMSKKTVEIEDYNKVLSELNSLKQEKRMNELKQSYEKNGGNLEYFNDFAKLNQDLDPKDVPKVMKNHSWAFQNQDNSYNSKVENMFNGMFENNKSFESLEDYVKFREKKDR